MKSCFKSFRAVIVGCMQTKQFHFVTKLLYEGKTQLTLRKDKFRDRNR